MKPWDLFYSLLRNTVLNHQIFPSILSFHFQTRNDEKKGEERKSQDSHSLSSGLLYCMVWIWDGWGMKGRDTRQGESFPCHTGHPAYNEEILKKKIWKGFSEHVLLLTEREKGERSFVPESRGSFLLLFSHRHSRTPDPELYSSCWRFFLRGMTWNGIFNKPLRHVYRTVRVFGSLTNIHDCQAKGSASGSKSV